MINEDLRRWFKEKWVDISRKTKSGKHPPCGRSKASDAKYPKCRPSVRVSSQTPQTSGEMSKEEKKGAVRQKRSAESKVSTTQQGRKPVMTSHKKVNESISLIEKIVNHLKPETTNERKLNCSMEKQILDGINENCLNKKAIVQFLEHGSILSHAKGLIRIASNSNLKEGYDLEVVGKDKIVPVKLDEIINLKFIDNNVIKEFKPLNESKNKPTNPGLWSKAKSLAKKKFKVYPSAYANGWASKWYKQHGGGWKSVNEETEIATKVKKSKLLEYKNQMKNLFFNEEIVNAKHAGTMTKKEIKSRDKIAKKVKAKPIKGNDTAENAKYRLATYIELKKRGQEPKGKKGKKGKNTKPKKDKP